MNDSRLIRMGGYFALIVGVMQIVGNGLHPPIPTETVAALTLIATTSFWIPIHVIITISYFMFIPFAIGASALFKDQNSPYIPVARALVFVGAGLGAAQILTHLTFFKILANQYVVADAATQANITFIYEAFWPYNVALEIVHLVAIFAAVSLFGLALLQESVLPRWIAWVGVGGGALAILGILASKLVINNDLVFGVSLLPLLVWILAVGINLLRLKAAPQTTAART